MVGKFFMEGTKMQIERNPIIFALDASTQEGRTVSILVAIDGNTTMYSLGILEKTTNIGVNRCMEFIILTGSKHGFHGKKKLSHSYMSIMFSFNITSMDSTISDSR